MKAALLEASITPASISIPVSGELISGTSEIPLRIAYSPSISGLPVVKLGAATWVRPTRLEYNLGCLFQCFGIGLGV